VRATLKGVRAVANLYGLNMTLMKRMKRKTVKWKRFLGGVVMGNNRNLKSLKWRHVPVVRKRGKKLNFFAR
jgi:hypothetical protein